MLGNLTFVVLLHQTKWKRATKFSFCFFEQLLLQKATSDFFWATFEQLLEKLRATLWEILSNLWKALTLVIRCCRKFFWLLNLCVSTSTCNTLRRTKKQLWSISCKMIKHVFECVQFYVFPPSSDMNPCHSLIFGRDHSRSNMGIISGPRPFSGIFCRPYI